MPSSVIRAFAYDPASRCLTIDFVSGRRYIYRDVPPREAAAFAAAPSRGGFFNRRIRDRYRYARTRAVKPRL